MLLFVFAALSTARLSGHGPAEPTKVKQLEYNSMQKGSKAFKQPMKTFLKSKILNGDSLNIEVWNSLCTFFKTAGPVKKPASSANIDRVLDCITTQIFEQASKQVNPTNAFEHLRQNLVLLQVGHDVIGLFKNYRKSSLALTLKDLLDAVKKLNTFNFDVQNLIEAESYKSRVFVNFGFFTEQQAEAPTMPVPVDYQVNGLFPVGDILDKQAWNVYKNAYRAARISDDPNTNVNKLLRSLLLQMDELLRADESIHFFSALPQCYEITSRIAMIRFIEFDKETATMIQHIHSNFQGQIELGENKNVITRLYQNYLFWLAHLKQTCDNADEQRLGTRCSDADKEELILQFMGKMFIGSGLVSQGLFMMLDKRFDELFSNLGK